MRIQNKIVFCLSVGFLLATGTAFAQEDVAGSKDHPLLTRMPNYYITDYEEKDFDQADFRNKKGEKIKVEGYVYRISYAFKEGFKAATALQVLRNYENALRKIGGVLIYEESPYEAWLELKKNDKKFWVYVDSWSGGGEGETYNLLIVEKAGMAQEVVANAENLAQDISSTGHASVYGILFDFNKAEVKPESEPTLKEITKLLQQNLNLKLYVVGHTDNVGDFAYNMKLSQARADSVVKTLVSQYGIDANRLSAHGVGPLAPVTSNKTEEGRAKNRRVELVEQK
jgi:OOP family OmpA-OmpF porin